jgi:PKD repeat protein
MRKTLLSILLVLPAWAFSQISFSDASTFLQNSAIRSGKPIAIADMNGDGLDDIVRLDDRQFLYIAYQQPDTAAFVNQFIADLGSPQWGICIADVDDNGFNDILTGGQYTGLSLLKANVDGTAYAVSVIPNAELFLQGVNFVDIDNDGFVDIFASNQDGISQAYRNDGNGTFSPDNTLILPISSLPSDNSGNQGSVWIDYNNDGHLDLYISKGRLGADDPVDPRRLNLLFRNDGNNNFIESASMASLQPLAQSWASDFADIDNDGDLDCFVINHESANYLFRNNGNGTFTDISATSGLVTAFQGVGTGMQAKFADFDNDGFVDLLFTTISGNHALMRNNGNGAFTRVNNAFGLGSANIHSAAVGDLNDDGFLDVYAGFGFGLNQVSNESDRLFLNQGNANHYFKLYLKGLSTNASGVGARVELYGSWGKQIREVRSGESHGIMNSLTAHFGLGAASGIDSLLVRWPSGNTDKLTNPPIDTLLILQEGDFCLPFATFQRSLENLSASFSGSGDAGIMTWQWDFGDGNTATGQNVTHTYAASGQYLVCLTVSSSCGDSQVCQMVNVQCGALSPFFQFIANGLDVAFQDLSTGSATSWHWTFGDGNESDAQSPNHGYSQPGNYFVCLELSNDCESATICQFVQVSCAAPFAIFDYQTDELSVQFIDFSAAGANQWLWDFGDGTTSTEQNPLHQFPATGTYEVCLSTDGVCGPASYCETVAVSCPPPVSQFFAVFDELQGSFEDASLNTPTVWAWDFGDGATSGEQNPVHAFAAPGSYEVCLATSSPCGIGDTLCQTFVLTCTPPQAGFSYSNDELVATFVDTSSNNPTEWLWVVAGVDTFTTPSFEYTFAAAGDYEVCLQVASVCGMTQICQTVSIACAPLAPGFSYEGMGLSFSFSDTTGSNAVAWSWDFGDGETAVEAALTHVFALPGDYEVCLEVLNACGDTAQICQLITVDCAPPDAQFEAESNLLTATFMDVTAFPVLSRQWSFGDGVTSTQVNPQHTYSAPGIYEVCLAINTVCGADTTCQEIEIICVEPEAGFSLQIDELTVSLMDTSQNAPTQWSWAFGDGNNSSQQNPQHTFAAPGNYVICLLAINVCGNSQVCRPVTVSCAAPQAAFAADTDELAVAFNDQSANNPTAWQWDFGDGNTSTASNPQHAYAMPGTYQVCLTASSVCGSSQSCQTITVTCAAPQADFALQANELTLTFTDISTNNPTAWQWDFGDGNTSTTANPQHTYAAPGSYQICLSVSSVCGDGVVCQTVEVSCAPPQSAFSFLSNQLTVIFNEDVANNPSAWAWDFGDGSTSNQPNPQHSYAAPGSYTVCLTASSICGQTTQCQSITLNCQPPVAGFTFSPGQLQVAFAHTVPSATSFMWNFGDGNTSSDPNPMHTYGLPGSYQVCLVVSNLCGSTQFCQQVLVNCSAPQSNFSTVANELTVTFNDLTTNSPSAWFWLFGDGGMSMEQNPTHTYTLPGNYLVCLSSSSPCGSTQRCQLVQVSCDPPQPAFSFLANELVVFFLDASSVDAQAWQWDFGDGNISTSINPQHTYAAPGSYEVCLTVNSICGSEQHCATINVSCAAPAADFAFVAEEGLRVTFEDLSVNNPTAWLWDFGDGTTSTAANPVHTYSAAGAYNVCLRATSLCGSDDTCQAVQAILTSAGALTAADRALQVFPNPSRGTVWLELQAPQRQLFDWALYNSLGQLLFQGQGHANEAIELDLSAFPAGLYWIRAGSAGGGLMSRAIVRQ